MSSCVPVITTNVGIVDEIVSVDSKLLTVVEFNNVKQAVNCLMAIFLQNKNNKYENAGCIQRKFVKQEFSVDVIADKYRKLYLKYLDHGRKGKLHASMYRKAFRDSISCDYYFWFKNEIKSRIIPVTESRNLYIRAFKHDPFSFYPYLIFIKTEKDNCFFIKLIYLVLKIILCAPALIKKLTNEKYFS